MESGWNVWVWLLGVVVRRYIDFLILLIPNPLVSVLFYSSIPTFCSFFFMFFVLWYIKFIYYMRLHSMRRIWSKFENHGHNRTEVVNNLSDVQHTFPLLVS